MPQVLTLLPVMEKWHGPSQAGTLSQIQVGVGAPGKPLNHLWTWTCHVSELHPLLTEPESFRVDTFYKGPLVFPLGQHSRSFTFMDLLFELSLTVNDLVRTRFRNAPGGRGVIWTAQAMSLMHWSRELSQLRAALRAQCLFRSRTLFPLLSATGKAGTLSGLVKILFLYF